MVLIVPSDAFVSSSNSTILPRCSMVRCCSFQGPGESLERSQLRVPSRSSLDQPVSVSTRSETKVSLFSASVSQIQSRSEEHTSELQSLMRISYAVFCLKKTKH